MRELIAIEYPYEKTKICGEVAFNVYFRTEIFLIETAKKAYNNYGSGNSWEGTGQLI